MFKVVLWHRRLVLAAEHANLKVLDLALLVGGLYTCDLEVLEILENHFIRADGAGYFLRRLPVRDEFLGQSESVYC